MVKKKGGKIAKKEDEAKKKLIMWAGISLIMILILIGWIFSVRKAFNQTKNNFSDSKQSEWSKIKNELNQTIADVKNKMEKIKNDSAIQEAQNELQILGQENQGESFPEPLPLAEDISNKLSEEKILELKNKLE